MPDPSRPFSQEASSPYSHSHQVRGPWGSGPSQLPFHSDMDWSLLLLGMSMGAECPHTKLALIITVSSSPHLYILFLLHRASSHEKKRLERTVLKAMRLQGWDLEGMGVGPKAHLSLPCHPGRWWGTQNQVQGRERGWHEGPGQEC